MTARTNSEAASPSAGASWRSVAVPSEHGGWSLTAEPALLGLIVAWSWAGFALALAAMIAFVARTPLKLMLVDRWRHRWLDRSRLAAKIAAVELLAFTGLVIFAAVQSEASFWLPFAVAAPLVVLELWFDMRSRGRRLIPELAGSIGIGSIATAIALADGTSDRVAWGLWIVIAARSVAAIPYVRTQIHRAKSQASPLWYSDVAQLVAIAAAVAGWLGDLVPAATVVVMTVLAVVNIAAVRLSPRRAVVIGIQQMFVGVAVIATTAIAILAT